MRAVIGGMAGVGWVQRCREQGEEIKKIVRACEEQGTSFVDPLFPPSPSSLAGCTGHEEVCSWRRPSEMCAGEPSLFQGGMGPGDVIQGKLKDCWYLGALSIMAGRRRERLEALVCFGWVARGIHAVRFFVEGSWVVVVVDDLIPCDRFGKLVFGRCRQLQHCWVQIFEKAFAKLCGSYADIEGGSEEEALVSLTGGMPKIVDLREREELLLDGQMWAKLVKYSDSGHLMGCANHVAATSGNIIRDHAYSVLSVYSVPHVPGEGLLLLRNPWGRHEWTGRFSRESPSWEEVDDNILCMLGLTRESLSRDVFEDGSFFICWEDFYSHFDRIYVCKLPKPGSSRLTLDGKWQGETAGGCLNHPTFTDNPQYHLTVPFPSTILVQLFQKQEQTHDSWRLTTSPARHIGLYVVLANEQPEDKTLCYVRDAPGVMVAKTKVFLNAWQTSVKFRTTGYEKFVIFPCTYNPQIDGQFAVSIVVLQASCSVLFKELTVRYDKTAVRGEWGGDNCGGCMNHTSWLDNPAFLLHIRTPGGKNSLFLQLSTQMQASTGMGLYVFAYEGEPSVSRRNLVRSNEPFLVARQVSLEVSGLVGSFLVLPCTFEPLQHVGDFTLTLFKDPEINATIELLCPSCRQLFANGELSRAFAIPDPSLLVQEVRRSLRAGRLLAASDPSPPPAAGSSLCGQPGASGRPWAQGEDEQGMNKEEEAAG